MVCTVRLKRRERISFSSSATITGTTRFSTILDTAMMTVLESTCQLSGWLNMYLKLFSPTHLERNMPLAGTNFSNAMTMPDIGAMLNTSSSSMAGSIMM